jgi:hypothetical protein
MRKLLLILLVLVILPTMTVHAAGATIINSKDKLISPWMMTVIGERPYVLDNTDLVKIEDGKRKVLSDLWDYKDYFETRGIDAGIEWFHSAVGGMLQERNGNLYFSYFLTQLETEWENPFLQQGEKPNQGSGWQYLGIWKYNLKSGKTDLVYFEKARYWPGFADDDSYESEDGNPVTFSYQGQAVQYLGWHRYLGRFYVDEEENIWGIWQKNKYEDDIRAHIWKIDKAGAVSVAWSKPYGTPIDMSNDRNDSWGYVFPRGKDLILFDGGWRIYTLNGDGTDKLTVDENILAFYARGEVGYPEVPLSRPRMIDDTLYVLTDSGVWKFNWEAKNGKQLWQSVYKPKPADGPLSIQDYAISSKGNLYLINYTDGTVRMISKVNK